MKFVASTLALLSSLTLTAAQPSIGLVLQDPNFSTLLAALQLTGLDAALVGGGPFTVFAPSNAAFASLQAASPGTLEAMLAEDPPDTLRSVLLHHVANGVVASSDIVDGMMVPMLSEENATLTIPPAMIEGSNIVMADIDVQEGIVHVIDLPIVPSTVDVLPSIFLVANSTGQFTILLSLIESVGLGAQLNTPGPFTVFAPTDEAFAKIPNLEEVAADPAMVLGILTNHVLGGYTTSDMLSDGQTLTALGQQTMTVSIDGTTVMIDDSTVVLADLLGSNGVVHAIDTVIGVDVVETMPTGMPSGMPAGMMESGGPTMEPNSAAAANNNWAVVMVVPSVVAMLYSMLA